MSDGWKKLCTAVFGILMLGGVLIFSETCSAWSLVVTFIGAIGSAVWAMYWDDRDLEENGPRRHR